MEKYEKLLKRDNTCEDDNERKALFYILANNRDLYYKANYIYDFDTHMIKTNCFEKVDFCSSSRRMIKLAFNLYNGYNEEVDVLNTFAGLDEDNFKVALESIRIRFNRV